MAKKGLGKGLGAIFGEDVIKESEEDIAKAKAAAVDKGEEMTSERMVKLALIEPNKDQPRKDFNEEQLRELADSIKRYGVLQPLLVQKKGDYSRRTQMACRKDGWFKGNSCCAERIYQAGRHGNRSD